MRENVPQVETAFVINIMSKGQDSSESLDEEVYEVESLRGHRVSTRDNVIFTTCVYSLIILIFFITEEFIRIFNKMETLWRRI